MKPILSAFLFFSFAAAKAQTIDSLFINLYTDSLKKGTYNYINVDGLLSNGRYIPQDSTKILFTCAQAKFYGNTIFIPVDFNEEKVKIRAALRTDEKKYRDFEVFIKNKNLDFKNLLFDMALGNNYHLIDDYKDNIDTLQTIILKQKN